MKLVLAVVQSVDTPALVSALNDSGLRSTVMSTTGGFLRSGNSTVLVGVSDDEVDQVLELISRNCQSRVEPGGPVSRALQPGELTVTAPDAVEVGGGVVFVLAVDRFARL